jgi:putative transposase
MKDSYPKINMDRVCKLFGYSRQAYYQLRQYNYKCITQSQIIIQMVQNERYSLPGIGGRKLLNIITQTMAAEKIQIGRDAFFDLLRDNRLMIRPYKSKTKTTNSHHWYRRYPNLIRELVPHKPHEIWVSDITYIETNEGFLYLSLVTDAYSRKIVGWNLSPRLEADGAVQALQMALQQLPEQHALIHHSDRGIQYCCDKYVSILRSLGINISMTENGDPLENAIAERVNGILKSEWLSPFLPGNKTETASRLIDVIDAYNNKRPHLSINMMTPEAAHTNEGDIPRLWKSYWKDKVKPT